MLYLPEKIRTRSLGSCICSVGHYAYFMNNQATGERIAADVEFIRKNGLDAYIQAEYKNYPDKAIIINEICGNLYIVDGNRHALAIYLARPETKIEDLNCIRFWNEGLELKGEGSYVNERPYTVYIPVETDTDLLKSSGISVSTINDYFKPGAPLTKEITASLGFDSILFRGESRGRCVSALGEDFRKTVLKTRSSKEDDMKYEILGNFNNWGDCNVLDSFRFDTGITMSFDLGDRFKVHVVNGNDWYGWESLNQDYPEGCFSAANDNYGGFNIYVSRPGRYRIIVDHGKVTISEA